MHDFGTAWLWIKTKLAKYRCLKMLGQTSAQTVAAAVPRSPEFMRAFDDNAELEAKQKSLHAEIAELSKGRMNLLATPTIDATAIDARLAAIGVELRDLEKRKQAAIQKIRQQKPAHVAAVRASLLHRRHAAAKRVVHAIEELDKAAAELDATAQAIIAAGGAAVQLPNFPLIGGLKKIAEKIANEP